MVSADGESINMKNCSIRGEVDEWLQNMEDTMRNNIKTLMRNSITKYE